MPVTITPYDPKRSAAAKAQGKGVAYKGNFPKTSQSVSAEAKAAAAAVPQPKSYGYKDIGFGGQKLAMFNDLQKQIETFMAGTNTPRLSDMLYNQAEQKINRAAISSIEDLREGMNVRGFLHSGVTQRGIGDIMSQRDTSRISTKTNYDIAQADQILTEKALGAQMMSNLYKTQASLQNAVNAAALGYVYDAAKLDYTIATSSAQMAQQAREADLNRQTDLEVAKIQAGGGHVICTELRRQGYIPESDFKGEVEYATKFISQETYLGYRIWAEPVVRVMRKSPALCRFLTPFIICMIQESSYRVGRKEKGSIIGSLIYMIGVPFCNIVYRIYTPKYLEVCYG
jgi:hypothetical protein